MFSVLPSTVSRRSRAVPTAPRQDVESSSESSDESLYDVIVGDHEIDTSTAMEPRQIAGMCDVLQLIHES